MKNSNDYEDKYNDIKSYLQTMTNLDKVLARANESANETHSRNNRYNDIYDYLGEDKNLEQSQTREERYKDLNELIDELENNKEEKYEKPTRDINSVLSSNLDDVDNFLDTLKDKDKPTNQYFDENISKTEVETSKTKKSGWQNILFNICIFLASTFGVLSTISMHSTELIFKPLNYVCMLIFVLSLSTVIYFIIIYFQEKRYKEKKKKSKLRIFKDVVYTLYITGCISFLLILYGPYSGFRDWLITTAMSTMHHQHYCKWFYSEDEINAVLSNNYVLESGESTDESLIDASGKFDFDESDPYEAQLFSGYKDGDTYKIIELTVNGCDAYLAVIYDPSTISLAVTSKLGVSGQYVKTMAENNNAVLAINGGGFSDPGNSSAGGTPTGVTISNGKLVTNGEYGMQTQGGGIIGFTNDNKLVLLKNTNAQNALNIGVRDAVTWGPFLIVNGEPSFIKGNGGWGYAARTAIGQRADGVVLLLVVDSNATRTSGADMVDLTEIMQKYKAINAANLDGGTSSVMVENGVVINDPIDSTLAHQTRPIATSFIVKEK